MADWAWGFEEHWDNRDLIRKLLLDKCPDLDIDGNGTDRMIYITCRDDLYLYLKFLRRNGFETDKDFTEYFSRYILERTLDDELFKEYTAKQIEEYSKQAPEFAQYLVNEWWKKFLVRTKVVFQKNPEMQSKMEINNRMDMVALFTQEERDELYSYIEDIFIRNGERCFLTVLADQLCKNYIHKEKKMALSQKDKLQLMEACGAEAKRMCYTTGMLVWMLPNYKARVREWRDDRNGAIQR